MELPIELVHSAQTGLIRDRMTAELASFSHHWHKRNFRNVKARLDVDESACQLAWESTYTSFQLLGIAHMHWRDGRNPLALPYWRAYLKRTGWNVREDARIEATLGS